jgi:glycosyl transferase family 25
MKGFAALNAYFDRVVVVTLARATERHALLRERLAGLDHELFHGSDARGFSVEDLERRGVYSEALARRATRHRRPLRPAEIGCSLSHRAIYERVHREGWQRVLVLEDDVVPLPDGLARAGEVLAQLPPSWELLYLGYEGGEVVKARHRVKQAGYLALSALGFLHWRPREVLGLYAAPFTANLRRAGKHHCTHAYAVTAAGAKKLLEAQTPVAYSSDQLLLKLCIGGRIEAYLSEPKLFGQDSYQGQTASLVQQP